jgi:hypothetical protein
MYAISMRPPQAEAGHTLVEVTLACAVMVVIFGAGLALSADVRHAWAQVYTNTGAVHGVREALQRTAGELAVSSPACVGITGGTDHDAVTYQLPVSLSNGTITWGADGVAGREIRLTVVNGQLRRQVVDTVAGETVVASRLLVPGVDALHEGRKGFRVTRTGNLCTITLRIRSEQGGRAWRNQITTGVLLRNP